MKRVAQVIRLRPERADEYRRLHRDVPGPVLDRLRSCHITNYSIHLLGDVLFGYFEYHGADLDADLAHMAEDPDTLAWWRLTDPCQLPVDEAPPGAWWTPMEEVFHMA